MAINEANLRLLQELDRLSEAVAPKSPHYVDWTVSVVRDFDGNWGVSLDGPKTFYRVLVSAEGQVIGAKSGANGTKGDPTKLSVESLVRILDGFR